ASPGIAIDGGGFGAGVRVMQVDSGATLSLNNLTIAHGFVPNTSSSYTQGAGILNDGTLTVTNSTFSANITGSSILSGTIAGFGGDIANTGSLTVTNSTFSGNLVLQPSESVAFGGAIYSSGTLTVTNSTFSGNEAGGGFRLHGDGGA